MLRSRYDKKKFLLFGLIGFLFVTAAITLVFVLSSDSLDDRSLADGMEEERPSLETTSTENEESIVMILEPSSGIISGDALRVDLILDTKGEEISGIDVTLEYSGDIEYLDFEQGEIENCIVEEASPSDLDSINVLSLYCFIDASQPAYEGIGDIFATVIFRAFGDGGAEINITNVDFAVRDERMEISYIGESATYSTTSELSGVQPSCGSLNNQTFPYSTTSWPNGTFCSEGEPVLASTTFPEPGSTVSWQCASGSETVSCSAYIEAAPPSCGTLNGQTFPSTSTTWPSSSFCSVGQANPLQPAFPLSGATTAWQCFTPDESISCSASKQETLPETSILNNTGVFMGFALVLISAILLIYKKSDSEESYSMRNKLS